MPLEKPFAEWSEARAEQGSRSRLGVIHSAAAWIWVPHREHGVEVVFVQECSYGAVLPLPCFSAGASSLLHPCLGASVAVPARSWAASVLQTVLSFHRGFSSCPLAPFSDIFIFLTLNTCSAFSGCRSHISSAVRYSLLVLPLTNCLDSGK